MVGHDACAKKNFRATLNTKRSNRPYAGEKGSLLAERRGHRLRFLARYCADRRENRQHVGFIPDRSAEELGVSFRSLNRQIDASCVVSNFFSEMIFSLCSDLKVEWIVERLKTNFNIRLGYTRMHLSID